MYYYCSMHHSTYNKYVANAEHKILRTTFFCQSHISIFLGNLFDDLKLLFLPKYRTNTYFTLKFFRIFDETI